MPNQHTLQHYVWFSDLDSVRIDELIHLEGPEAHHAARVKRVRINDSVGVLDGQGRIATGVLQAITGAKSSPTLQIQLQSIKMFDQTNPSIEIWSALPKGDHLDRMIDQLAQLGVARYRPLICERSQRNPSTIRIDKLERIAREAAKQCHRPWGLKIEDPIRFEDAIRDPDAMIADISGDQLQAIQSNDMRSRCVILIGPEGGWSDTERAMIAATNVKVVRFGVFVLRIEAAASAASAIVLSSAESPIGRTS
tara:strand:+ start:313 stop:1068 length:756 start_codon:yes stop_codon:yes gene_type:complete